MASSKQSAGHSESRRVSATRANAKQIPPNGGPTDDTRTLAHVMRWLDNEARCLHYDVTHIVEFIDMFRAVSDEDTAISLGLYYLDRENHHHRLSMPTLKSR